MIKQECIGIPDMILLLMNFFVSKKIKIKAEIVLSTGGPYFVILTVKKSLFFTPKYHLDIFCCNCIPENVAVPLRLVLLLLLKQIKIVSDAFFPT